MCETTHIWNILYHHDRVYLIVGDIKYIKQDVSIFK